MVLLLVAPPAPPLLAELGFVEVLVEAPSPALAEATASLPPLLLLTVLLAAPPVPVAIEVSTPSLPADSSAGSALPQASA